MQRALLLINPHSRRGSDDLARTLDILREGGLDLITPPEDWAFDLERAITELGPDCHRVIVGGGDGTLNGAIEPVMAIKKPLGILPLGTANDLARTLELPRDPEGNASVILQGRTRLVDVGQVNDTHFFNVASLGMSGDVAKELDSAIKAKWGVLGYPISLWRVVTRRRAVRVEITCDDMELKTRAIQVSVGNGRFYGGGMTIAADATIDDGVLDLVLMKPQTIWQLLGRLPIFRWGRHDLNDRVRHLRGRSIDLTTSKPLPINTDGEITTETPAAFRLVPNALEIFVS